MSIWPRPRPPKPPSIPCRPLGFFIENAVGAKITLDGAAAGFPNGFWYEGTIQSDGWTHSPDFSAVQAQENYGVPGMTRYNLHVSHPDFEEYYAFLDLPIARPRSAAEPNGSNPANWDVRLGGEWGESRPNFFPPLKPLIPKAGTVRKGVVVRDGQALKDEFGPVHLYGLTFFWSMQGSKWENDRFFENLKWLGKNPDRPDILRSLFEVDWANWAIVPPTGHVPTAAWDDWSTHVARTIDAKYSLAGALTEACVAGKGTGCDYVHVANAFCDVLIDQDRWQKVPLAEMGNEWGDFATMIEMAKVFRRRLPQIASVALSSVGPNWDETIDATRQAGGTCITIHSDRDPGSNKWRQVRQMRDCQDGRLNDFLVSQNEPPGPHSSIATNDSPLQLALMRYTCHIMGGAHYVLHVGDMVTGKDDASRDRHANLWEVNGLPEIMKAVRGVDKWLPAGVENWTTTNQHGATERVGPHPLLADGIWTDGDDHGVDRTYGAVSGQNFVQVINGVKDYVNMKADRTMKLKVFEPVSGALAFDGQLNGGQSCRLEGRADTMAGYIAVGNWV